MTPIERLLGLSALVPPPRVARLRADGNARGRALVSYLRSARWHHRDPRLHGHSNHWESRQIARTFARLGFDVDVVEFTDRDFRPDHGYDIVLAIDGEMLRLGQAAGASTLLLHQTGAYAPFQNAAERRRVAELRERRGVQCVPRRLVSDVDGAAAALGRADACSLIGNGWTLSTFPEEARARIRCIPVSGSTPARMKTQSQVRESGSGFLWFFGAGAVHKGLDRVLDVFDAECSQELHVVGNIGPEADFLAAYRRQLTELPNVHWHGALDPAGDRFAAVAQRCSHTIAPSCSEGTSPATVTMLQFGLYPIVSRETGVDLPKSAGRYLERCTVDEIATAVSETAALPPLELRSQIGEVQRHALETYTRPAFARAMHAHLARAIDGAAICPEPRPCGTRRESCAPSRSR